MSIPVGVDPAWIAGNNFVMIHLDLVDALDGDWIAAGVLNRIQFRAGGADNWWRATFEELKDDTRLTDYVLRQRLKILRDKGFIESRRRQSYDPILEWRVVVKTPATTVNEETTFTTMQKPTHGDIGNQSHEAAVSSFTPLTKNSKELSKNPPISPHAFDEFWTAYPRKEGKGQARPAFDRAAKKVGEAVIVTAAVEYRQWCDSEGKEKRFIPMPATWLNGERWTDERVTTQPPDRMQGHLAHIKELWETENGPVNNSQRSLEG